jgi:hypothetical protein
LRVFAAFESELVIVSGRIRELSGDDSGVVDSAGLGANNHLVRVDAKTSAESSDGTH